MKKCKITIIALVTLFTTTLFAQETEEKTNGEQPKHEVSLDVLDLIALKKFEISYNYLLNESESIGAQISFFPDNEDFWGSEGYQENFSLGFNYRHYFSKKYAQGFYVEGFTKYSSGKSYLQTNNDYEASDFKKYHALDIGFGLGYKYVSKRNFYIDANINIRRSILSSIPTEKTDYYLPNATSNIGLTIGKQF